MDSTLPSKAISLKPQWEALVFNEQKKVENRSYRIKTLPSTIAIHRSGKNGAIRCIATVSEILTVEEALEKYPTQKEFIHGPLCWILTNVRRLSTPCYCKGQLRLWNLGESLLNEIKESFDHG